MIILNDAIFCCQIKSSNIENPFKKYRAKVLLFGEYTVIDGGPALAMPLQKFSGNWLISQEDTRLVPFFEHLLDIKGYDTAKITRAIKENWCFESTIPQGYGAGSSGALSAAAFGTFYSKIPHDTASVHRILSETESFFHGKSSGLDPLTSYYDQAVLKHNDSIELLRDFKLPSGFYLYDSLQTRNTKALVNVFINKKAHDTAFNQMLSVLDALNQKIINCLIAGEAGFEKIFNEISVLQFNHFSIMIPDSVKTVWEAGLTSGAYDMKLSGAGGGGYFLLYAKQQPELSDLIRL